MFNCLRGEASEVGAVVLALILASPAHATLDIVPTFDASITADSNAAAIESAINAAASAIGSQFSNPFEVSILFEAVHGGSSGFLAGSESTYYGVAYSDYVSLLQGAAAANPANAVLNEAVANLAYGNKGGTFGIAATNTVLQALGVPAADVPGGYDASGNWAGGGPGVFDGVILINIDQPLTYTQPLPAYDGSNVTYDAVRAMEHEIDEVLGGGGSGSTLNDVAYYGVDNPNDPFTFFQGALDLYRYSAPHVASFSTNPSATSYFSVDGGVTSIVGFNQYSQGDFGDFGPTTNACSGGGHGGPAGLIQDAFVCNNETGEAFTSASPEYKMLEALGYNPLTTVSAPELPTWALMMLGAAGLGFAGCRRRQREGEGQRPDANGVFIAPTLQPLSGIRSARPPSFAA